MDPYKLLSVVPNPDGSLTRLRRDPRSPPTGEVPADPSPPVLSKDFPLNPARNTWLRLYLPRNHRHSEQQGLPIIVDFHGGGFVFLSAVTTFHHEACNRVAAGVPSLVVSVEYRLAPEHRLPAAYDDAIDALLWVKNQATLPPSESDPWVTRHGDFARCFLSGTSAGGNIAYHATVRALGMELRPVQIVGVLLKEPFFGGEERTDSESRSTNDRIIPLAVNDILWELSLPHGADRDHEFSNPMKHPDPLQGKRRLPKCLVTGYVGDPLVDRQREFVRMLEGGRAEGVVARLDEEGLHGADLFDPAKAEALVDDIRGFVDSCRQGDAPPPLTSAL